MIPNELITIGIIMLIPFVPIFLVACWHDYKISKAEDSAGDFIDEAEEKGVESTTEMVLRKKRREAHEGERNILRLDEREILSFFNMGKVPHLRVGHLHHDEGSPVIEVGLTESLRKYGGPFAGWYRTDVTHYEYEIEIRELDEFLDEEVIYVETDDKVGGGRGRIEVAGISTYEEREYEDAFGDTIRVTYEREWEENEWNRGGYKFTVTEKEQHVPDQDDVIWDDDPTEFPKRDSSIDP